MIKVLLDTNIIVDVASERKPFYSDSKSIFQDAKERKIFACISASAITDIYYLLRKSTNRSRAINFIMELTDFIEILGVDKHTIIKALSFDWTDFEDAVQAQAAIDNNIDFIITRNAKDFLNVSNIKILTPKDFIALLK